MTGRLVLPGSATEADWLAARAKGITASEIGVLMGLSPYGSPFELYHRKLGNLPPVPDNDAMALGRYLEGFVVNEFERRRPELASWGNGRDLFRHEDRDWQMATPDKLLLEMVRKPGERPSLPSLDPIAVLEAKTSASYDGWGDDGTDEIPVHYRCQNLWQMDVLGVTTGYVAALFLHSRQLRVYELTMDDQAGDDLKLMREEAEIFRRRLETGNAPEVDWRPATATALKHLHPSVEDRDALIGRQLVISYRAALRHFAAAEKRKAEMTNRIRDAMGSARRAVAASTYGQDGKRAVIATRSVYEVKAHTRKASTTDKLVPAKIKEPA